eukprot:scaffold52172_cov24-Tisochrysis_lutea.AAC.1
MVKTVLQQCMMKTIQQCTRPTLQQKLCVVGRSASTWAASKLRTSKYLSTRSAKPGYPGGWTSLKD